MRTGLVQSKDVTGSREQDHVAWVFRLSSKGITPIHSNRLLSRLSPLARRTMRFGLPEESDASDASSIYSYTSDDSDFEVVPKKCVAQLVLPSRDQLTSGDRYAEPISHLGRRIRGFVDSSDSELDTESDDDFGLLGIRQNAQRAACVSELFFVIFGIHFLTRSDVSGNSSSLNDLLKEQMQWQTSRSMTASSRKGKEKASDWNEESSSSRLRVWMKTTEEEAMVSMIMLSE